MILETKKREKKLERFFECFRKVYILDVYSEDESDRYTGYSDCQFFSVSDHKMGKNNKSLGFA